MGNRIWFAIAVALVGGACASFTSSDSTPPGSTDGGPNDAGSTDGDGGPLVDARPPTDFDAATCTAERLSFDDTATPATWASSTGDGGLVWSATEGNPGAGSLEAMLVVGYPEAQISKVFPIAPTAVSASFNVKAPALPSGGHLLVGCSVVLNEASTDFTRFDFEVLESELRFEHDEPGDADVTPSIFVQNMPAMTRWMNLRIELSNIRANAANVAAYVDGVQADLGRTEFPIKAPAVKTRFKCGIDDGTTVDTKIWVDEVDLRICP